MCAILGFEELKEDLSTIKQSFDKLSDRGPDDEMYELTKYGLIGFKRLSIMGLNSLGMQPFHYKNNMVVCNGEIYNFRQTKKELISEGYEFKSESDCEILLPLYEKYGCEMFKQLDAEFALIIYDAKKEKFIVARDPIGIRPIYYGVSKKSGKYIFASEPKSIIDFVDEILFFPPGYYYDGTSFVQYTDITKVENYSSDDIETVCKKINEKLTNGVLKRLDSDANVGYLLSGGLDSSLVCAIAQKKSSSPIKTFSIGMSTDAIDLKYAKEVADYIGSDHKEIIITKKDVLDVIPDVIERLATFDITTIRASIGMYLICKKIHELTDIKVLLTGEISDELFGYKYTDYAPSPEAFQQEAVKRISEIHMYDVLRADRCISSNSLEARVPFGDLDFVKYVMSIDPKLKVNTYNKGKYLLRKAFEGDLLPHKILFREKAAFSDAVGHSMVDYIKEYANSYYTDEEFEKLASKYSHAKPFTKESLLYRETFEHYYPSQSQMILDFWMPNKSWEGCNVDDPSARVLANYKESGI